MEMIGAKIPSAWKELIRRKAREYNLEESEVVRYYLKIGFSHDKEVDGELFALAKEGELIVKAKRALQLRRVIGHFGGHQSGWRTSAERIENPTVQKAYLDLSEGVQREVMEYLTNLENAKGRPSFLEWFWDNECEGCTYRIKRDKEWCEKYCKKLRKLRRKEVI
jgi:hypothetical protein